MSSTQGRKPKSENYAYSWFLPATGNNGTAMASQLLPSGPEAAPANAENSEMAAMEARTEQWRHSGETKKSVASKPWSISPVRLRLAGVSGWSAVAAVGAIVLATRAGPFPGTQLGILGGVWVGISALVWFLVGKL